MQERAMGQYDVVSGEKAILTARIRGNALVQAGAPMKEVAPNSNTWECTVGNKNIAFKVEVNFPDTTAGSQVDISIDGEINGQRGDGPFTIFPILPSSAKKDPTLTLFIKNGSR